MITVVSEPQRLLRIWERGIIKASWDYNPGFSTSGVFQFKRGVIDGDVQVWGVCSHLVETIVAFVLNHRPRPEQWGAIIDGDGQTLMSWRDGADSEYSDRYKWWGCRVAFEIAAAAKPGDVDWQLMVASWEQLANKEVL